jgi:ABC-2 type transport system ATP-binding protein
MGEKNVGPRTDAGARNQSSGLNGANELISDHSHEPSCNNNCILMQPIISVSNLSKIYASGFRALNNINLDILCGEIFALLGPNGAGKTTLIGIVCGIINATKGKVTVDGHDIVRDYRAARSLIGLVPQELTTDAFETVWATVNFSRGLWGLPPDPDHIAKILESLSLLDKKNNQIRTS